MDCRSPQTSQVRWWRDTNWHPQVTVAMDDGRRAPTQPGGCRAGQESAHPHPHSSPGSTTMEKSREWVKNEPGSAMGPSMASTNRRLEGVQLTGTHSRSRTALRPVPSQYGGQYFPALPRKRCGIPALNSFISGSSAPTAPTMGAVGMPGSPTLSPGKAGTPQGAELGSPTQSLPPAPHVSVPGEPQHKPGGGPPNCPRLTPGRQTQRLSS